MTNNRHSAHKQTSRTYSSQSSTQNQNIHTRRDGTNQTTEFENENGGEEDGFNSDDEEELAVEKDEGSLG